MSFFDYKRIAEGYAKDRPYYHLHVMEMLKKELCLKGKYEKGLDVGCGAGASALALQKICRQVIGVDESEEMIKSAEIHCKDRGICFFQCRAEEIKMPKESCDIITAAGSVNWIDEDIFLKLANGILKDKGILLIYDNPMIDQMERVPEFTTWWNKEYLARFPKPPRKETVWGKELMEKYGFQIINQVTYKNTAVMNREEFIRYIMTQTNVIEQIEKQGQSLEEAKEWFEDSLKDIFQKEKQTLVFEGYNWYFQKEERI